MAWICKGIIFIHIWAFTVVQFLWALHLSWTDSVMQCWGLAMFVGANRTCPLPGVHGFSGIPHNSCSTSVKWRKMCVKTGQRTFPDSLRACRAQAPCAENFFFHEVLFAKPPSMVCIQHCPFWSKQKWEQFYSVFFFLKKNSTRDTHTKKSHSLLDKWRQPQDCYNLYAFPFQCCRWGK